MYRRKFSFFIKDYFSFTSGERRGIAVLFIIILITIGIRIALSYFLESSTVGKTLHKNIVKVESKDTISKHPPEKERFKNKEKINVRKSIVEINSCDTADLELLRGIGPVFSRRILRYRESLGGYYTKSQILEVFGMTTETYNRFIDQIVIDTSKVQKLELNKATFREINAHPYISFEQTKQICKLRNRYQKLSYNHILHCDAFDSIQKIKVLRYLQFN